LRPERSNALALTFRPHCGKLGASATVTQKAFQMMLDCPTQAAKAPQASLFPVR